MRRAWCWSLTSAALLAAGVAEAATYVQHKVFHEIRADGSVLEGEQVAVRLESDQDLHWMHYDVVLDDNIELDTLAGSAVLPDGTTLRIDRKEISDYAANTEALHNSTRIKRASFVDVLPKGAVVRYQGVVTKQPYYPSGAISLYGADPIEELHIEVRGPAGLRWKIEGDTTGLEIQEEEGRIVITGRDLPRRSPMRYAPSRHGRYPLLRYSWGGDADWEDVGDWYHDLVAALPRDDDKVLAEARAIVDGVDSEWEKLSRLVEFAQSRIRYVAVEVGIGGYQPTSPGETNERRWGDCKDKSLLLVEMLEEVGIPAHLALIQSSLNGRINPQFPSNVGFNHVIVAVERQPWMERTDLAFGEDYLFVDPTQTRGRAEWLGPETQDKYALVVREGGHALVRTPTLQQNEARRLEAELTVTPTGKAGGPVSYTITGALASSLQRQLESEDPARTEESARSLLGNLFPGGYLSGVSWETSENALPRIVLRANVRMDNVIAGSGDRKSFRLPSVLRTPESRVLTEREVPVVLRPVDSVQVWRLRLPGDWCPAQPKHDSVENDVGRFEQVVSQKDNLAQVRRSIEIRRRWVEPGAFAALRELSLAEHRSSKRRIRLSCPQR